jgi:hypothetical protein
MVEMYLRTFTDRMHHVPRELSSEEGALVAIYHWIAVQPGGRRDAE